MLTKQQALQRMKADIQLRGLSESTFRTYTSFAEQFLKFCDCPIDDLTEMDVRRFLGHLIVGKKLKEGTVNPMSST